MNAKLADNIRCSSSGSKQITVRSHKLVRLNTTTRQNPENNSSLSNESDSRVLEKELGKSRSRLSQVKDRVKKNGLMSEWYDKEKAILEDQLQMERLTTKRLREDVKTMIQGLQAANRSRIAVESELSLVKTTFNKKIHELKVEHILVTTEAVNTTGQNSSAPSQLQDVSTVMKKKLQAAEQRIMELKDQLKDQSRLKRDFDSQRREFERAKVTIQKLQPATTLSKPWNDFIAMRDHVEKLEEELRVAKSLISSHLDAEEEKCLLKEKIYYLQKRLEQQEYPSMEENGEGRAEGVIGVIDSEGIEPFQEAGQNPGTMTATTIESGLMMGGEMSDQANDYESHDESNSSKASVEDDSPPRQTSTDMPLAVVKLTRVQPRRICKKATEPFNVRFVRPTNSMFFKLDWDKEYEQIGGKEWKCNKCPKISRAKPRMRDHVWVAHYGETFQCIHCSDRLSTRYGSAHNKKAHPQLVGMKTVKNA
ncbi:tax1-binding protein 1 homolog B-like [Fopius arisanus]|uniref:Tax1-binding protein 1 homolog B-like n=1 Tax=Fopius arisanus TaxID=64838 RepID=A0A9R1STK0_9HYME|nr:PREDICTED: tax1-binding protein 1 homolog B-like [Fopius arisanus]